MIDPLLEKLTRRFLQSRSSASPFAGVTFRSTTPEFANSRDLITGEGGRRHGGRWNPIGIAAVYSSMTPETALAEALAHFRYHEIPVEDAMPRVFVALDIHLQSVFDFRCGANRRRARVSLDRILNVDWRADLRSDRKPLTQLIGHAAFDAGFEALIVPSAVDREGQNLVLFPDNLQPTSIIQVQRPDRLK